MLSRQLEVSLRLAVSMARQKRHEFLTVEHLLLALLDNDSAVNALKACGADIVSLRKELEERELLQKSIKELEDQVLLQKV